MMAGERKGIWNTCKPLAPRKRPIGSGRQPSLIHWHIHIVVASCCCSRKLLACELAGLRSMHALPVHHACMQAPEKNLTTNHSGLEIQKCVLLTPMRFCGFSHGGSAACLPIKIEAFWFCEPRSSFPSSARSWRHMTSALTDGCFQEETETDQVICRKFSYLTTRPETNDACMETPEFS